MRPRWQRPLRACVRRKRLRRCKRPSSRRVALPGRAIPCCCLLRAPASTCFATTDIAATCSPPPSTSSSAGPHDFSHHVLRNAGARANALPLGLHHVGVVGQPLVGGADHCPVPFHFYLPAL